MNTDRTSRLRHRMGQRFALQRLASSPRESAHHLHLDYILIPARFPADSKQAVGWRRPCGGATCSSWLPRNGNPCSSVFIRVR